MMKIETCSLADLAMPATREYQIIEQICEWERHAYGEGKHRMPEEFYQCVQKNRTGFFVAMSDGALAGYADVWQLEGNFYAGLRSGLSPEEALNAEVIVGTGMHGSGLWYIGSMIIAEDLRHRNRVAAAFAFASLSDALPGFFSRWSAYPAKVLGVGSSSFGKKLLTRWECTALRPDPAAIDLRPRYEKTLARSGDERCFYIRQRIHPSSTQHASVQTPGLIAADRSVARNG